MIAVIILNQVQISAKNSCTYYSSKFGALRSYTRHIYLTPLMRICKRNDQCSVQGVPILCNKVKVHCFDVDCALNGPVKGTRLFTIHHATFWGGKSRDSLTPDLVCSYRGISQ